MRIKIQNKPCYDLDIEAVRSDIASISENKQPLIIDCNELLNSRKIDWDGIKRAFQLNFKQFDDTLFKLHFKRKRTFSEKQQYNILKFLTIGYQFSQDVRFFNEFLYFYKKGKQFKSYLLLTQDNFFQNINNTNNHCFPLSNIYEIRKYIDRGKQLMESPLRGIPDSSLRIGLLGSPSFFKKIRDHLVNCGFYVHCFFIPYHPDNRINFLFNHKVLFRLFCFLKKIDFQYDTIHYDYKDDRIAEALLSKNLDIGFHKLGFIIKRNIISGFKTGLINDHWAILPFIRGRSTIEYSLLFGFPVIATTHFVEEGVDSGGIIGIYEYKNITSKGSNVRQIREAIRRDRDFRAINSIEILSRTRKETLINQVENGLTYYSMHPSLIRFIENKILKLKPG